MPGKEFFTQELNRLVRFEGTKLRIVMKSGGDFYVHDIVKTHDEYVRLNVYEPKAAKPIVSSTSEIMAIDLPQGTYKEKAIRFDAMAYAETIDPTGKKLRVE